ncbi:uncharacterized protein METZ01_LOCUS395375 [marine metagenome]|uniref:Uncharacterized protein n=1 Tax=marine metagenome TaxID=408172 RepID=A0A382V9G3_9ZZZZ
MTQDCGDLDNVIRSVVLCFGYVVDPSTSF